MPDTINAQDDAGQNQEPTLDTMTNEQFQEKLNNDKEFRAGYLKNPNDPMYDRLNAEYAQGMLGTAPLPPQETAGTQSAKPDNTKAIESGELVLKIRPELLGTYFKNDKGEVIRPAEDAVLEAIKGNAEKDRYINSLRTQSAELQNETMTLRSQLQAMMSQASSPKPPDESSDPQDGFDFSEVDAVDKLDTFNPEDQGKLLKIVKGMGTRLKRLSDSTRTQQQTQRVDPGTMAQKNVLSEIAALQAAVPQLKTSVPFEVLDQEMTGFFNNVQRVAGKPLADAWNLYHAQTPEGQQFRDTCAAQNVVIPPEYEIHQKVMELKGRRDSDLEKMAEAQTAVLRASGRLKSDESLTRDFIVPAPNMSFHDYWQRAHGTSATVVQPQAQVPAQPNPELQRQIQMRQEEQRQFATPTASPNMSGAPVLDISQMTPEELAVLTSKSNEELTADEAATLLRVYEYANQQGKVFAERTGQPFSKIPISAALRKRATQAV